jgi:hypothetical protein
MTLLDWKNVRCANCGKSSEQTVLESTNAFGSPDLDLRPPEMQRSTMETWLQLCPSCGYCAPDITQAPSDSSILQSQGYQAALQNHQFPELVRRFLAYAVALEPSESAGAAQAYLQAAWVCDDGGLVDQARECRQRACARFRALQPLTDTERGVTTGAVFVDVLRRSGQLHEAASECRALLSYRSATPVHRTVLEYQQQLIAQGDTSAHTVSESDQA